MRIVPLVALVTVFSWMVSPAFAARSQWNIVIYIAADNDLEANADSDLEEIAQIGSTDDVNVLVQVKRPRLSSHPGTTRYRVEKGAPYGNGSDTISENPDSADPETLKRFIDWSCDTYPAEHTAVVIWSHGQGWRAAKIKSLKYDPGAVKHKAIIQDDSQRTTLYQYQLETVFEDLAKVRRSPDLIGFDACLMSMLEVWSGLQNLAKIGVGSEDLEPGFGWDYKSLLEQITARPSMSPIDLGITIATTYSRLYKILSRSL